MSENSENIKRILSEIGGKFEELFVEIKKEASDENGEIKQAYSSLKSKLKEAEDDVKIFVGNNQETIDKVKSRVDDITNEIGNVFERTFHKKKN